MTLSVECCGENQVILIWEFVQICPKASLWKGWNGSWWSKTVLGHVSFDGQACAIWVLYFKGDQVLLLWSGYCHLKSSLNSCWGCHIWSKSYNRYYVHFGVPWIFKVDSYHPYTGTTNDYFCCFCQLSVHVGTCSICRPWFSWGLVGCLALPSHL